MLHIPVDSSFFAEMMHLVLDLLLAFEQPRLGKC